MKIWVDADACPLAIKKILFKAANRTQIEVILVANQFLPTPPSPFIKIIRVMSGFDVADNAIIDNINPGDLVVTADIPLAHAIVEKGGAALNPRGELYTNNNIKQRLTMRNFNEQLRDSGIKMRSIPSLSQREIQLFANNLDKILAAQKNK